MSEPAVARDPKDWVEDVRWHRQMFRQSNFRWVAEDPMTLALNWTRGRLVYETPRHLSLLDSQLIALRTFADGIEEAMLPPLKEAQQRCRPSDYRAGLQLVGLTAVDVSGLRFRAPRNTAGTLHPEARRAMQGFPWPNPFSQVWELRQMRSMYTAAEDLLEDLFCDLVAELSPAQGWEHLASLCRFHWTAQSLIDRVDAQRAARGLAGDPRRIPHQRYDADPLN